MPAIITFIIPARLSRLTRCHRLGAFDSTPSQRLMFARCSEPSYARNHHIYHLSAFVSFNPLPPARRV